MAKKRARTERREADRAAVKDAKSALKLASLLVGGAAEKPIVVTSASVIEPQASSQPCVVCGESIRIQEHIANPTLGLRVVTIRCTQCGVQRDLFFRIAQPN